MASIAKGVGVSGFNPRSLVLTVLVVAIIGGLFFIPEIIEFQGGLRGRKKQVAKTPVVEERATERVETEPVSATEEIIVPPVPGKSRGLVDRFLAYFQGERGTSPAALRRAQERAERRYAVNDARLAIPMAEEAPAHQFSWKTIKTADSIASLKLAQKDSLNLARSFAGRYPETSQAIYAFASGIKFLLGGTAERSMSAHQAATFIQRLYQDVNNTLLRENATSGDYNIWTRITLGPAFSQNRMAQQQGDTQMPFNPQLRVVAVRVAQQGNKRRQFVENSATELALVAVVRGNDVKKVEIYRDDVRLKDRIPKTMDRSGYRYIFLTSPEARGVYTFRAVDYRGQTYTKSYNFYSVARRFPWAPRRGGRFIVPVGDYDPRLDRIYLAHAAERRAPGSVSYFTTIVGRDIARF